MCSLGQLSSKSSDTRSRSRTHPSTPCSPFSACGFCGAGGAESCTQATCEGWWDLLCVTLHLAFAIPPGQAPSSTHYLCAPGARPPSTAPHQPSPGTRCGGCTAAGWCGSAFPGCTCAAGGWLHQHPQQPGGHRGDKVPSPRQEEQQAPWPKSSGWAHRLS